MTGRGRRPRRWRWLVGTSTCCWPCWPPPAEQRRGRRHHRHLRRCGGRDDLVRHDREPDGLQPEHARRRHGGHPDGAGRRAARAPSCHVVTTPGEPTANWSSSTRPSWSALKPETIVYTLNPKAVWSDGVPITAADFKYAWEQQRGDPVDVRRPTWRASPGYRDIASVTGSNGGPHGHREVQDHLRRLADAVRQPGAGPRDGEGGWNPSCTTVDPAIDLSGGPFMLGQVTPQTITLVQNPKWWGTPANAKSITIHLASSTAQLAQWMASGYVQVAAPSTVTQSFLTQMTGLPGAQSEVDTSATLLQLDMASSARLDLPPDLRVAVALSINRQDLVNQEVSWASRPSCRATATSSCRASRTTSRPRPARRRRPCRRSTVVDLDDGGRLGRERQLPGDPGADTGGHASSRRRGWTARRATRTTTRPSARPSSCTWSTTRATPGPRRRRR